MLDISVKNFLACLVKSSGYNEYEIEYFLLGKYSRKDALSIEKKLIMHLEKYMSKDRAYEIIGSLRKTIRRN